MKHKHCFTLIILLLLSFRAEAVDVYAPIARKVAELFLEKSGIPQTKGGYDLQLINYDEKNQTRGEALPAYYIFNLPQGGFVMVSAIDGAVPVLAYSFEHSFSIDDDMPENLRGWLSGYENQILAWRKSGDKATADMQKLWDDALSSVQQKRKVTSVDLQTPDWGQGSPFNQQCPLDSLKKRSLVGCTAVAYSQICYYYKHPEKGTGTLPSYTAKGITVPENVLGRTYNYSKMLTKYKGASYSSEQADAVAALCFDIADMCKASFGSSSTSASTTSSAPRLATYMGYDKGTERHSRNYSSAEDWKNMLKKSIDAKEPILYYGDNATSGTGHAFVVDGYDSDDKFLINFGWNGSSNGFYELDAFGAYTKAQGCLTGIVPDRGGQKKFNLSLIHYLYSSGKEYNGIKYLSGDIKSGGSVYVTFGHVKNVSVYDFDGYIRLGMADKGGNFKCWLRDSLSFDLSAGSSSAYKSLLFKIPSDVSIHQGDVCKGYFRTASNSTWYPMTYNDEDPQVCGAFPLHIADMTSLTYVPESKQIRLYTMTGAQYEFRTKSGVVKYSGTVSSGSETLDVSSLSSGTYALSVSYGGNSFTVNIIL